MTSLTAAFIMTLAGAALFWLRGAAFFNNTFGRGKTTADAVWATGLSLLAFLNGLIWWAIIPLAFTLWLGGRLPWWRSLSLGRNVADHFIPVKEQWLRHSARGVCWTLPAALFMAYLGHYFGSATLILAGATAPIFWEAGWRWLPDRATEIGELGFGALIAFTLWVALQ